MNERVEVFRVMPNLRWVERVEDVPMPQSVTPSGRTIKVLQQLHLGDMGTEKWVDVPTIIE